MSDPTSSSEPTPAAAEGPTPDGSSKRLVILLGILAVGLAAFAYDRLVARPAVEQAYEKIIAKNDEINQDSTRIFTNLDVQQLIGKEPSSTFFDDNGDTVEVYQWRAGMPLRTHDLFAVYKKSGDALMFYRGAMGKYETGSEFSQFDAKEPKIVIMTEEEMATATIADGDANAGGGAGPDSNAAQERLEQEQEDNEAKEASSTDPAEPASDPAAPSEPAPSEPAPSEPAPSEPAPSEPAEEDDSTK